MAQHLPRSPRVEFVRARERPCPPRLELTLSEGQLAVLDGRADALDEGPEFLGPAQQRAAQFEVPEPLLVQFREPRASTLLFPPTPLLGPLARLDQALPDEASPATTRSATISASCFSRGRSGASPKRP